MAWYSLYALLMVSTAAAQPSAGCALGSAKPCRAVVPPSAVKEPLLPHAREKFATSCSMSPYCMKLKLVIYTCCEKVNVTTYGLGCAPRAAEALLAQVIGAIRLRNLR